MADLVRPPQRADARRNYDRLVAAAGEVFAAAGIDASLDEIARRAGVGNATLYRHFPTRHALLLAVCVDDVETLCALGDDLARCEPPGAALTEWLHVFVEHVRSRHGLAAALMAGRSDGPAVVATCQAALHVTGSALLTGAQTARAVRDDVRFDDLLRFVTAIAMATETDDGDGARRFVTLMLEGFQRH